MVVPSRLCISILAGLVCVVGLTMSAPGASAAARPPARRVVDTPPIGSWDVTTTGDGSITVTGWARDANTNGNVTVGVITFGKLVLGTTGQPRPDLTGRFGADRGFSLTMSGLPSGTLPFCVGVANVGPRPGNVILGCRWITVPDTVPVGSVDVFRVNRDRIDAVGWAALKTSGDAMEVRMSVNGQTVSTAANGNRPDLVGAGLVGTSHGFGFSSPPLPSGSYPVCVGAFRPGQNNGRILACQTLTIRAPFGSLDVVIRSGNSLVAAGWAVDADAPNEALTVNVTFDRLDDISDPATVMVTGNQRRADVGAAYSVGPDHGFTATLSTPAAGTYRVCAATLPAGPGAAVNVGCRTVVMAGLSPTGRIERITTPTATSVRIEGWMADPETSASIPITVRVGGVTSSHTAAVSRPDVSLLYPGLHGFDITVTGVASGVKSVCVSAVGTGLGGPTELPCGTVVMGSIRVSTSGSSNAPTTVGPLSTSPIADIDRDAGISTRLRDGSTLWLFGDSSQANSNGSLQYFVNNTAAWAAPGSPAITRDGVTGGPQPARFVAPTAGFPTCPSATPTPVMWPLSAVTVPNGALDRVIAYYQNICLGPNLTTASRGVATVEWSYDPADPPVDRVIEGTVTNQALFPTNTYGNAAVVGLDGKIYSYACFGPASPGWPDQYGPCKVARTDPSTVADATSYRYWDGATWGADVASAAPMSLPNGVDGVVNPVGTLTVTFDAVHGVYVMAYSTWPGYSDKVAIRVASSPQGPWSAPVVIQLPGCNDTVGGTGFYCYAGTAQPQFSGVGLIGIGYYDQIVAVGPNRGSYLVVTVPFTVVLT